MHARNTKPCNRCGNLIYFDEQHKSQNDKFIPMDVETNSPHSCGIKCPHCGKIIEPQEYNTFDYMCKGCRRSKDQLYQKYRDTWSGKIKERKVFRNTHKVESGQSVCEAEVSYCVLDDIKNEKIEIHAVACSRFLHHFPNDSEEWYKMKNYDDAREKAGTLSSLKDYEGRWIHPVCCKNNN